MSLYVQKSTVTTLTADLGELDLGDGTAYRLSSSGPITIDGMFPVANGRLVVIDNIGDHLIRFKHQGTGADPTHRCLTIDGDAMRIYPGYAGQWQYDGTSGRWRELATVPFVRAKGDLLTHDALVPARLPVSPTEGHVLRAAPDEPLGMKWGPPSAPNVGDWWHWVPGAIADVPAERWAVAGLGTGGIGANEAFAPDTLIAIPLPRPRGGTVDKVGLHVYAVSLSPGARIDIGLYGNLGGGLAYPAERLAMVTGLNAETTGAKVGVLDTPLSIEPGTLLWLVFLGTGFADTGVVASVAVPGGMYPILGSNGPTNEGIGVGWTVGWDPSGMGPNGWPYADGLPSTFPDPDDVAGVEALAQGNPPAPAIHVHFTA